MPASISIRFSKSDVAIIDRTAWLRGRSRTDFVRDAAVRAAEAVIFEQPTVRVPSEDFAAFRAAVEAPGAVLPGMLKRVRMARRAQTD